MISEWSYLHGPYLIICLGLSEIQGFANGGAEQSLSTRDEHVPSMERKWQTNIASWEGCDVCLFEYVVACVRCVCHLCDHVYDCVCAHVSIYVSGCVCHCVCDMIYCVHGCMCAMVCVSLLFRQKTRNIQKYVYICEHSVSVALHYYSVFFPTSPAVQVWWMVCCSWRTYSSSVHFWS